ncbi:MAG TPA: hypothetical protein EYN00_07015 [Planctomycetes bacterium]|nr:hypothetical protein [Planctomycetota bacterium]
MKFRGILLLVLLVLNGNRLAAQPLPGSPFLDQVVPAQGQPGDSLILSGLNFSPNPLLNRVTFPATVAVGSTFGLVTSVEVTPGPGPDLASTLTVVVPSGVRTGTVALEVQNATINGQVVTSSDAGSVPFIAAPELIGWVVGDNADATLFRDAAGNILPDFVYLYGYNLTGAITDVEIFDGISTLSASSIVAGPPVSANYTLPPGIEMIGVELPAGLIPLGDTWPLKMTAINGSTAGTPLESSEIDVPWRFLFGPGIPSDMPAYIAGAVLPRGIRRGNIEITANLLSDPPNARWTLVPEYLSDPQNPDSWLECTLTDGGSLGVGILPGGLIVSSLVPAIVGPGERFTFTWNSETDLPGALTATRIRLRPRDPVPAIAVADPAGEWVSGWLVINNTATASGVIEEEFWDSRFEDFSAGDAIWNGLGSEGTLLFSDQTAMEVVTWGSGTVDLVLLASGSYLVDTDIPSVFDVSAPGSPADMIPGNPGAAAGEIHLHSLAVVAGAIIEVVGESPLVIRLSGDAGLDSALVVTIGSPLVLRGQDGTEATIDASGSGGAGGPGGGAGGSGGSLEIDNQGTTISEMTAGGAGGLNGGEAGGAVTWVNPNAISIPKAGCAGGGGGAVAGSPGETTFLPPTSQIGYFGAGGFPFGDDPVTRLRGGGGGGGGGACAIRVTTFSGLAVKHGGGGGGGGGAIEIAARGRIIIGADVDVSGGAGKTGTTGTQAGAGGGGGGGTIALRATGNIEFTGAIILRATGGAGASATTSTTQIQKAGDGADGRIRIESNSSIVIPVSTQLLGVMTTGNFTDVGKWRSRGVSLPYPVRASDGVTGVLPVLIAAPAIEMASGPGTAVRALYEGYRSAHLSPGTLGTRIGPVGDPALLGDVEYLRVRWLLDAPEPPSTVAIAVDYAQVPINCDPNSGDFDGDLVSDSCDADDDNDGWSDVEETTCGTDPLDGSSVPVDSDGDGICDAMESDNPFERGDVNGDGALDLSDGVVLLEYLFIGGALPTCLDASDVDDDGLLNLTDAIVLLNYLFLGGPAPGAPSGSCGVDPSADVLGCASYGACP